MQSNNNNNNNNQTSFTLENALSLLKNENKKKVPILPDTKTENGALAFSTTGNACLDLFSMAVRGCEEPILLELFRKALDQDPKSAVAIIMHLRDARDGKGEKALVLYALIWLRTYKPKTYLQNLKVFIDLGYHKDLCILVETVTRRKLKPLGQIGIIELEFFAELLKRDRSLKNGISLAGKWAPTERTHFDKAENGSQARALARLIFPESKTPDKDYRQLLSGLRESLKVVEKLMSEGRWNEIDFGKTPSKAHRLLRGAFGKHQEERYQKYLEDLLEGKAKINVKGTQPHELVNHYLNGGDFDGTIEGQFNTLIQKLEESGCLNQAFAVCDVSGSMSGNPMQVSIALGLVVAETTSKPFKGSVISFSSEPHIHEIEGNSVQEKVKSLDTMDWNGQSTDLLAVFDLILQRAKESVLAPEKMIKTLFIFTDMQFDEAEKSDWGTTYDHICKKYKKEGYEVPQIVFWNLRASNAAFPTREDTPGVALVSGFSAELLKVFMEGGEFTPLAVMKRSIKPYLGYVVLDSNEF